MKNVIIPIAKGRTIIAKQDRVEITKLKLYPLNVRFRDADHKLTQTEMEDNIKNDQSDTQELYNQIRYAGGVRESLILDSNYFVREGNRRLVCCRLLIKEHPDEKKSYETVPCIILPEDTPEMDIALYLASIHVTGKKRWKKFNQTAHIFDLNRKYEMTYDDISDALSISKKTIST